MNGWAQLQKYENMLNEAIKILHIIEYNLQTLNLCHWLSIPVTYQFTHVYAHVHLYKMRNYK